MPRVVSVTSPTGGAVVASGAKITLSAGASDNKAVSKAEFFVKGKRTCSDSAVPYSCSWAVPRTRGASYSLDARAYDAAGNIGSHKVTVRAP